MSKPKLTYESQEPAFLRKLRGQVAGLGGDSDRHERPLARPRLQKSGYEDEDEPTYVVEETGESYSKSEYEALITKEKETVVQDEVTKDVASDDALQEASVATEPFIKTVAEAGTATRKRKLGKVVGSTETAVAGDDDTEKRAVSVKKPKKKSKGIKLAFDEP